MTYLHTYIELTEQERKELELCLRQTAIAQNWRARKRLNSIHLSDRGVTIERIAKQLEVTDRSVRGWFALYRKKGIKGLI